MTERIPLTILKNLVHNETYTRQVIPFIEPDYFEERSDKIVFEEIAKFLSSYDKNPTKEVLHIEVEKRVDINEEEYKNIEQLISALDNTESESEWLMGVGVGAWHAMGEAGGKDRLDAKCATMPTASSGVVSL